MLTQTNHSDGNTFTLRELRRIFRVHRGARAELARRVSPNPKTGKPVHQSTITHYLNGVLTSARIDKIAQAYAAELLSQEQTKTNGGTR
jgi:hypothetical protein